MRYLNQCLPFSLLILSLIINLYYNKAELKALAYWVRLELAVEFNQGNKKKTLKIPAKIQNNQLFIFVKICFIFMLMCVHLCVGLCTWEQGPTEARSRCRTPGAGITGGFEPPHVGVGN